MQVHKTYSLDYEVVKKLDNIKNRSKFVESAIQEKFNSTTPVNSISKDGHSLELRKPRLKS